MVAKALILVTAITSASITAAQSAQTIEEKWGLTADGDMIGIPSCIFINDQKRCIQSATHYDDVKKTLIDKYPEVASCNKKPSENCEFAFEWKASHKYLIVWTESGMKDDHIMDSFVTPAPRKINPHNLQPMSFETFVGPIKPITFSD